MGAGARRARRLAARAMPVNSPCVIWTASAAARHHVAMELVWGATLWALWSCWLLCQHLGAPAQLTRASAGLLVAELVLLAVHSYDCETGGCSAAGRVAGSAVTIDLPALTVFLIGLATVSAWHRSRRAAATR